MSLNTTREYDKYRLAHFSKYVVKWIYHEEGRKLLAMKTSKGVAYLQKTWGSNMVEVKQYKKRPKLAGWYGDDLEHPHDKYQHCKVDLTSYHELGIEVYDEAMEWLFRDLKSELSIKRARLFMPVFHELDSTLGLECCEKRLAEFLQIKQTVLTHYHGNGWDGWDKGAIAHVLRVVTVLFEFGRLQSAWTAAETIVNKLALDYRWPCCRLVEKPTLAELGNFMLRSESCLLRMVDDLSLRLDFKEFGVADYDCRFNRPDDVTAEGLPPGLLDRIYRRIGTMEETTRLNYLILRGFDTFLEQAQSLMLLSAHKTEMGVEFIQGAHDCPAAVFVEPVVDEMEVGFPYPKKDMVVRRHIRIRFSEKLEGWTMYGVANRAQQPEVEKILIDIDEVPLCFAVGTDDTIPPHSGWTCWHSRRPVNSLHLQYFYKTGRVRNPPLPDTVDSFSWADAPSEYTETEVSYIRRW